jgi:hypothetical protein
MLNKILDRVSKLARKTSERHNLVYFIELNGRSADIPCTFCFKRGLGKSCYIADSSSRCLECVKRGRSCDSVLVGALCESRASSLWFLLT